jgi:hypothetical protein
VPEYNSGSGAYFTEKYRIIVILFVYMWHRSVRLLEIFQTFSSSFHLEKNIPFTIPDSFANTSTVAPAKRGLEYRLEFEEVTFRASVFRFLFFI